MGACMCTQARAAPQHAPPHQASQRAQTLMRSHWPGQLRQQQPDIPGRASRWGNQLSTMPL
eukprot:251818-Alexandrium_andersonii.AAC.1